MRNSFALALDGVLGLALGNQVTDLGIGGITVLVEIPAILAMLRAI